MWMIYLLHTNLMILAILDGQLGIAQSVEQLAKGLIGKGVKQPGCGFDHPPDLAPRLKKE